MTDETKCQICGAQATHGGHGVRTSPEGEKYVMSTSVCATHKGAHFDDGKTTVIPEIPAELFFEPEAASDPADDRE